MEQAEEEPRNFFKIRLRKLGLVYRYPHWYSRDYVVT